MAGGQARRRRASARAHLERAPARRPPPGLPTRLPDPDAFGLGFMYLPLYRAWVVGVSLLVCAASWFVIEKSKLGAYLRAGTENPKLLQAFGVNVQVMFTITYGFGVALAAFAEVVLMTLLGGMGTVLGPSVGALVVVTLENYLADAGSWVTVITGSVFVVSVLSFRASSRSNTPSPP